MTPDARHIHTLLGRLRSLSEVIHEEAVQAERKHLSAEWGEEEEGFYESVNRMERTLWSLCRGLSAEWFTVCGQLVACGETTSLPFWFEYAWDIYHAEDEDDLRSHYGT